MVKFAKSKKYTFPYAHSHGGRNGNSAGGVANSGGHDNNRGGYYANQYQQRFPNGIGFPRGPVFPNASRPPLQPGAQPRFQFMPNTGGARHSDPMNFVGQPMVAPGIPRLPVQVPLAPNPSYGSIPSLPASWGYKMSPQLALLNHASQQTQALMDLQAYQNVQLNLQAQAAVAAQTSSTEKQSSQQPLNGMSAYAAPPLPNVQPALNGQGQPMSLPLVAGALNSQQLPVVLQGPPMIAPAHVLYAQFQAQAAQAAQAQAQAQAQAASLSNQALYGFASNGQIVGYLPQQVPIDPSQLQQHLLMQTLPAANAQLLAGAYASAAAPADNAQSQVVATSQTAPPNHNEESDRTLNAAVAVTNSSVGLVTGTGYESGAAATLSPSMSAFNYSNPVASYAGYQQPQQTLAQFQLQIQQQQQLQQQLQLQQQQQQLQQQQLQQLQLQQYLAIQQTANSAQAQPIYANDPAYAYPPTSGTSTPLNPAKRVDANGSVAASSSDNSQGQRATPNGTPPAPALSSNGSILQQPPIGAAAINNNGAYVAAAPAATGSSGVTPLMGLAAPAPAPTAVPAQAAAGAVYLTQQQMGTNAIAAQLPAAAPTHLPPVMQSLSPQVMLNYPNGYQMLLSNGAALPAPPSTVPLTPAQIDPNTLAMMIQQMKMGNSATTPAANQPTAAAMAPAMPTNFAQAASMQSFSSGPAVPMQQVAPLVNGGAPVFSPPALASYALSQQQAAAVSAGAGASLPAIVSQPPPIANATPVKTGLMPLATQQQQQQPPLMQPPPAPQQQTRIYQSQTTGSNVKHS